MKQNRERREPESDLGTFPRRKLSRVRIRRTQAGRFVVDCIDRPPRGQGKVLDLRRAENAHFRQWMTLGEAGAWLERGPDAVRRRRIRGELRTVLVHDGNPQRWHLRFKPEDVEELAAILRKLDKAAAEKKPKVLTITPSRTTRLPGPDAFRREP